MYLKMDLKIFRLDLIRVVLQKIPYIDDPCHDIRGDCFRDLTVFKQVCHRFPGIIIPLYLIDHGKVRTDIIPQAVVGFYVQVHHLFNMKNVISDIVDHVTKGFVALVVINRSDHVVIVPTPIFFP